MPDWVLAAAHPQFAENLAYLVAFAVRRYRANRQLGPPNPYETNPLDSGQKNTEKQLVPISVSQYPPARS